MPDVAPLNPTDSDDGDSSSWGGIAFGLNGRRSPSSASGPLLFVTDEELDQPVPSLPSPDPKQPALLRYHVVRHTPCQLPSNSPLATHLKAKCAHHLPRPIRRRDPRYLPPNKPSPDPRFALMPLRRTLKARGSQSPPKRSASGSVSPSEDDMNDANDEDITSMVAPPSMPIAPEYAKQTVAAFRASCLVTASRCAVSGKGQSWCISPAIGPGLQACHIVPQQHYHLYPDIDDQGDNASSGGPQDSPDRLQDAWQRTWSPENGILLMSHLHQFFDARLFSIHPDTLRIRAFVPYDVLTEFNGREAYLPSVVDRNALRHHYDMCCIENMAAKMPLADLASPSASRDTPGANKSLSIRTSLSATPNSTMGATMDTSSGVKGDPSKRPRSAQPGPSDLAEAARQIELLYSWQGDDPWEEGSWEREDSWEGEDSWDMDEGPCKRRRLDDYDVDETYPWPYWVQDDSYTHYVSPEHSREFLADVNWKLQKYKARCRADGRDPPA